MRVLRFHFIPFFLSYCFLAIYCNCHFTHFIENALSDVVASRRVVSWKRPSTAKGSWRMLLGKKVKDKREKHWDLLKRQGDTLSWSITGDGDALSNLTYALRVSTESFLVLHFGIFHGFVLGAQVAHLRWRLSFKMEIRTGILQHYQQQQRRIIIPSRWYFESLIMTMIKSPSNIIRNVIGYTGYTG